MARPLRIQYPGAIYHVMNRGSNKAPIFIQPHHDQELFLETLCDATRLWKIRIHAYALMANHYHLLVETPLPNLSRAMRHIDGVYTQRLNRAHRRDGGLFRGRFKSILVDKDSYFLELVRYIHLNSVRAGTYSRPEEDPYCSHRYYRNPAQAPSWLTQDLVLSVVREWGPDPHLALDRFVQQGSSRELETILNKPRWPAILGSKKFILEIREKHLPPKDKIQDIPAQKQIVLSQQPTPKLIWEVVCKAYGERAEDIQKGFEKRTAECRWALMYFLRRECHLPF